MVMVASLAAISLGRSPLGDWKLAGSPARRSARNSSESPSPNEADGSKQERQQVAPLGEFAEPVGNDRYLREADGRAPT